MACDVPQLDWRCGITVRRISLAVTAGAVAVIAIVLSTDQAANLLFLISGLLFAGGFGVPVATAAAVGDHPVGKLIATLGSRHQALTAQIQGRLLARLTGVASDVTLDEGRASRLVEQAIEQTAARWRGPIGLDLDMFLLCCAAQLAVSDAWGDPPISESDPRVSLARLSRRDRAIWVLRRYGVSDTQIAHMLDCSTDAVTAAANPTPRDRP
jgi:hypothetical protein